METSFYSTSKDDEVSLTISNFVRKKDFNGSISSVFKALGIPFKSSGSFWLSNEAELEYLYHDFCTESRKVLSSLHPDRGGDGHEFGEFAKIVAAVKKAFWRKGIGKDLTVFNAKEKERRIEKEQEKKTGVKNYGRTFQNIEKLPLYYEGKYDKIITEENSGISLPKFRFDKQSNIDRRFKIAKLLLEGKSTKEISALLNANEKTIYRVRDILGLKMNTQKRTLDWTFKLVKSRLINGTYQHSEETRKLMSLKSKGKKKSEQHKQSISKGLKGKKKSKAHTSKWKQIMASQVWAVKNEKAERVILEAAKKMLEQGVYPSSQIVSTLVPYGETSVRRYMKDLVEKNLWPCVIKTKKALIK